MKKITVTILAIFLISQCCLSENIQKDSIANSHTIVRVVDRQVINQLKKVNSSLHDISENLTAEAKLDSIPLSITSQLVISDRVMNNIDSINTNLNQITQAKTILGVSWDVFITIMVTLFIFFLGYIINGIIKLRAKSKETDDYRRIVFWGVESNKTTFTNNIERLTAFSDKISTSKDLEASRFEYAMTEIHKLSTIPFEKYVSVFLLNSKLKKGAVKNDNNIYNLISTIDYLSRVEAMVMVQYDRYNSDFNSLMKESNNFYLKIIDILQSKETLIKNGEIADQREIAHYQTLIGFIMPYVTEVAKVENKDRRGELLFMQFVAPTRDEIFRYNNPSSSFELLKIMGQFNVLERQWESNKSGYSQIFADFQSNIITVYDKLEDSVEYFQNNTEVNWF